jgi:hypothetical protein
VVSIIALFGCSIPGSVFSSGFSKAQTATPVSPIGQPSDNGFTGGIVDSSQLPTPPQLSLLGNFTFTVDKTRSVSANYLADGTVLAMQLTDDAGLNWSLTIPGDALDVPTTITMTALSDLQGAGYPSGFLGGILLEPDGLYFLTDAELTLSGSGSDALLVNGSQNGTAVEPALPGFQKGSFLISHFSSWALISPPKTPPHENLVENPDDVIENVKLLLANKKLTVPEPPSQPLGCQTQPQSDEAAHAQDQIISNYYDALFTPENDYIGPLLRMWRYPLYYYVKYDYSPDTIMNFLSQLQQRREAKMNLLFKTYFGKPDKLPVIARVAMKFAHESEQMAEFTGKQPIWTKEYLGEYIKKALDNLLTDIAENHNYEDYSVLMPLVHDMALLGVDINLNDFYIGIRRAMTFQLNLHYQGNWADQIWESASDFRIFLDPDNKGIWAGSGTATYVSSGPMDINSPPFPVGVHVINFDVCAGTASLLMEGFGPIGTESVTTNGYTFPLNQNYFRDNIFKQAFNQYYLKEQVKPLKFGSFNFPLQIRNKNVAAVDQIFDGSEILAPAQNEFHVLMLHSPLARNEALPAWNDPFTYPTPEEGSPEEETTPQVITTAVIPTEEVQTTPVPAVPQQASPANLPQDVPMYPNAQDISTFPSTQELTFQTTDSPDQVIQYYNDQLENAGWTSSSPVEIGDTTVDQWAKGDEVVTVSGNVVNGETHVSLSWVGK